MNPVIFTPDAASTLDSLLAGKRSAMMLADSNTAPLIAEPLKKSCRALAAAPLLTVEAGEKSKSPETAIKLWKALLNAGATRHSTLVCVGGGVVGDLGGFVASTFMRGIPHINLATTLLAAVDASAGGKTAINLDGVKNIVGTFALPEAVVVSPTLFATLEQTEVLSGVGEMLKHSLLESEEAVAEITSFDLSIPFDSPLWTSLIRRNVALKQRIVEADFRESGLRKVLNLGHTVAHATESVSHGSVSHGASVAWGLVTELILSRMLLGFDSSVLYAVASFVRDNYGPYPLECRSNDHLLAAMSHDKKNRLADELNFTLLRAPGDPVPDTVVAPADVVAALDITRDLL